MPAVWGEITAEEVLAAVSGIRVSGKPQTRLAGISTDFWLSRGNDMMGMILSLRVWSGGLPGS
jgi:hypothetical protein